MRSAAIVATGWGFGSISGVGSLERARECGPSFVLTARGCLGRGSDSRLRWRRGRSRWGRRVDYSLVDEPQERCRKESGIFVGDGDTRPGKRLGERLPRRLLDGGPPAMGLLRRASGAFGSSFGCALVILHLVGPSGHALAVPQLPLSPTGVGALLGRHHFTRENVNNRGVRC